MKILFVDEPLILRLSSGLSVITHGGLCIVAATRQTTVYAARVVTTWRIWAEISHLCFNEGLGLGLGVETARLGLGLGRSRVVLADLDLDLDLDLKLVDLDLT